MNETMMNQNEQMMINEEPKPINRDTLPLLLSARDVEKLGISKTMYYRLTHMASVPTILLGERRYIHRDRFFEWLDQQAMEGCAFY